MNIKLVSDGTPHGTKVINADTGEPVSGVVEVLFHISVDNLATATVKIIGPQADLTARAILVDGSQNTVVRPTLHEADVAP